MIVLPNQQSDPPRDSMWLFAIVLAHHNLLKNSFTLDEWISR